jgi:hypothetical protein
MAATETFTERPQISVIIPARNEEASLGTCLDSLISQAGVAFEIIVVDDHSTDGTGGIAASFASRAPNRLRVIGAGPLPAGWTGKNNAVNAGTRQARGEWLLFTDADTVHLPGSLARALTEAQEYHADLLSYSPEQIAVTFWEMATLPVVFAELARQYPPSKVSDPASPVAAANGQYILIKRETYDAIGGHAAIGGEIRPQDPFPLRRRRCPHPHVPQLPPVARRLDEESGAALSETRKVGGENVPSLGAAMDDGCARCDARTLVVVRIGDVNVRA